MANQARVLTPRVLIITFVFVVVAPFLPLLISPFLPLLISQQWDWWQAWVYAIVSIAGFVSWPTWPRRCCSPRHGRCCRRSSWRGF